MGPCAQVAVAQHSDQEIMLSDNGVYYVQHVRRADGRTHEGFLERNKCCDYVVMHKQPCRHMVCVFNKKGMLGNSQHSTNQTIRRYWSKCFHSNNYLNMYKDKTIRQPEVYTGKYVGPEDLHVLLPVQRPAKRGRPKTARYKSKRRTVKDVVTSRVYRIIKILDSPEI